MLGVSWVDSATEFVWVLTLEVLNILGTGEVQTSWSAESGLHPLAESILHLIALTLRFGPCAAGDAERVLQAAQQPVLPGVGVCAPDDGAAAALLAHLRLRLGLLRLLRCGLYPRMEQVLF